MSKTIAAATKGKTGFEIREVGENTWKAFVTTPKGRQYVIDYASGDEASGSNPDGSPTIAQVQEAWRDDRQAFREIC